MLSNLNCIVVELLFSFFMCMLCWICIMFFLWTYSMVVAWMLLRHPSRQIIILRSMPIVLRRHWTGICYFTSYCCLHIMLSDYDLPFCTSRFAQFFIKPLMSPDATMREIKAVDSGSICLHHIWIWWLFLHGTFFPYFFPSFFPAK